MLRKKPILISKTVTNKSNLNCTYFPKSSIFLKIILKTLVATKEEIFMCLARLVI